MSDIERKLASVRKIAAIDPIPGADRIVKATVDGWELVTQKDNGFKAGDLVIYFEIDSFLPVRPEFEFLREKCFKSTKNLGDGFRLRTIKLRGQVSQGLILPLSDFAIWNDDTDSWVFEGDLTAEEGLDLTEYFGIQKYEKPIPAQLAGQVRGNFPSFLRKTDQERIQNCFGGVKNWIYYEKTIHECSTVEVAMLEDGIVTDERTYNDGTYNYYKRGEDDWIRTGFNPLPPDVVKERELFEATLKLDGSSMTVYYNDGQIGVCSRNLDLKRDGENLFWRAAAFSGMVGILAHKGINIAVQGELMGPGVQGNREGLDHWCFFIFDIFHIDQQRYLTPAERKEWVPVFVNNPLMSDLYKVKHVPIIDPAAKPFSNDATVQDMLNVADNTASINVPVAEGIVYKSHSVDGPTFKCISNKFLIQEKD